MTVEVGNAQVAIFPVFKGFRRAVRTEVDGSTTEAATNFRTRFKKAGNDSGIDAGRGFRKSFSRETDGAATAIIAKLTSEVAKESRSVSAARLKEQDAAGSVRVAEAALATARTKYATDSVQVIRAEERLASASRISATAHGNTRVASDALAAAQNRLATATDRVSTATSGGSRIQAAFSVAMNGVRNVVADAAEFIRSTVKVTSIAIMGTLGVALTKGFSRLTAIENASAKLTALGNTASDVASIMASALSAVQGTAFGLDEAATVAASSVAAGIKPGKELAKYLSLTADAAQVAGASLGDMGRIINQVTTAGRAQTEDLNQLAERGLPIYQWLAREYGVSANALRKMVSRGEVDSATFRAAIERNIGGAALIAGNTTTGWAKNMGAALGRLGAGLESGIFPLFKELFKTIAFGLDAVTAKVKPFADAFGANLLGKLQPVLQKLQGHFLRVKESASGIGKTDFSGFFGPLAGLLPVIGLVVGSLGGFLSKIPLVGGAFAGLTGPLGLAIGAFAGIFALSPKLQAALGSIVSIIGSTIGQLVAVLGPVVQNVFDAILPLISTIGDALGSVLTAIAPVIPVLGELIASLVTSLSGPLTEAIISILSALSTVITTLSGALGPTITALLPVITQIATVIGDIFVTALKAIVPVIIKLLPVITRLVTKVLDSLMPVFKSLTPVIGLVGNFIGKLGELLTSLMPTIAGVIDVVLELLIALLPLLEPLISLIGDILPILIDLFTSILGAILPVVKMILDFLVPVIKFLLEVITELIRFVVGVFKADWKSVWENAVKMFRDFGEGIKNGVDNILGFIGGIPGKIKDFFSGIGSWLINAGRDLINGFIEGIKSMLGKIGDIVSRVMKFVGGFFPHSPAKRGPFSGSGWTAIKEAGLAIGDQFGDGLDDASPSLTAKLRNLMNVGGLLLSPAVAGGPENHLPAEGIRPGDKLILILEDGVQLRAYVDACADSRITKSDQTTRATIKGGKRI